MDKYNNIDEYLAGFPASIQKKLTQMRQTIRKSAPEATEAISYGIPTFKLKGNLVHFAAFKNHIGFYPGSKAIVVFANELAPYEQSKGTIRFPLDKPLPLDLVTRIVQYRVSQSMEKAEGKAKKSV